MNIDKRSGRRFGPPTTKRLIVFLDDMNLPYVETYGTQNAIALLTQIVGYGTFFDRTDLGFRKEVSGQSKQSHFRNQGNRKVARPRGTEIWVAVGAMRKRSIVRDSSSSHVQYIIENSSLRPTQKVTWLLLRIAASQREHFPQSSACPFRNTRFVITLEPQIVDVQFLSAMNPTAGSFEICERLQRQFATFSCQMPSVHDLKLIYSSILSGHMLGWGDAINSMCTRIVNASIGIHALVS